MVITGVGKGYIGDFITDLNGPEIPLVGNLVLCLNLRSWGRHLTTQSIRFNVLARKFDSCGEA